MGSHTVTHREIMWKLVTSTILLLIFTGFLLDTSTSSPQSDSCSGYYGYGYYRRRWSWRDFLCGARMTSRGQKSCNGKKLGMVQHVHNCIKRDGKCCSTDEDGDDVTWASGQDKKRSTFCGDRTTKGYCWSNYG